jgi:Flp pilus assembly pilin Flp
MAKGRQPMARVVTWIHEAKAAARRERGQTLLEYALIVGFISVAAIGAMILLAPAIAPAFQAVTDVLEEHVPL